MSFCLLILPPSLNPPQFSLVLPLTLDQKYFAIVLEEFVSFSPDMKNCRIGVKCFHFEILYTVYPPFRLWFFTVHSMQITFPFERITQNNTETSALQTRCNFCFRRFIGWLNPKTYLTTYIMPYQCIMYTMSYLPMIECDFIFWKLLTVSYSSNRKFFKNEEKIFVI